MRAVLDTNVWLDWLVFDDPGIGRLRQWFDHGRLQLLATPAMRAELLSVLVRPLIRERLAGEPQHALAEYDRCVQLSDEPAASGLVCRDPDDQVFIDLAVQRAAGWLVTKDKALLALAGAAQRRFGLKVVVPAALPDEPGQIGPVDR